MPYLSGFHARHRALSVRCGSDRRQLLAVLESVAGALHEGQLGREGTDVEFAGALAPTASIAVYFAPGAYGRVVVMWITIGRIVGPDQRHHFRWLRELVQMAAG